MLNFEEFQMYAKEHIKEHLPEQFADASVRIQETQKNNGMVLHSLNVLLPDRNISPSIYLEGFFDRYEEGVDLDDVMDQIANVSETHQVEPQTGEDIVTNFTNYEFVKDKIIMTAISAQKNEAMLQNIPHTMMEDLAVIYKVMVNQGEDDIGTITIRNEHMKMWDVSKEEIHACAMKNSPELLPATCKSMNDVMREMFSKDGMPDDLFEMMIEDMPMDKQMYVISNEQGVSGASAIFYSDVLEKLSETIGTDVYILPSSIHETIAISTEFGEPETLSEMVQEVNAGQVAEEEQLSDHVYRYDAATKTISLADTTVEAIMENKVSENNQSYDATEQMAAPRRHR